jgi:hypothetical protein
LKASRCSELAGLRDDDSLLGGTSLAAEGLNLVEEGTSIGHLTEDDVLAIEVGEGAEGDEELRAVGVLASVGHGELTSLGVSVDEVLIGELGAVDGLATGAVSSGEVTTLSHEAVDHSVEVRALVVEGLARLADALLAGAESSEVLASDGGLGVELEGDAASGGTVNGEIEEYACHISFVLFLSIFRRLNSQRVC